MSEVKLKVRYVNHDQTELINSSGDTFTFDPLIHVGLASFLYDGAEDEAQSQLAYWKERAESAEKVIDAVRLTHAGVIPTEEECKLFNHWQEIKSREIK